MRTKLEIATRFAPSADLDRFRSFFFVGIGGAGMSAVAHMLIHRGFQVAGSDSTDSPVVQGLRDLGARIVLGHSPGSIQAGEAVVLTDAVDLQTSPEVADAMSMELPIFRRSQVLGWLLRDKKVIAVTGTHGKTTTTGMVGVALREAGLDPTIVVGAEVADFKGSTVEGKGDWAVVEACEAYDSFHDLNPEIVLLTNLEPDHLDFHGNWESLRSSVFTFISKIPSSGALVYCDEDPGARAMGQEFSGKSIGYRADGWQTAASTAMRLPGRHNWLNAQGAVLVAEIASGRDKGDLIAGVQKYGGADRRLQLIRSGPITVVDDYAHHPTEIDASISALKDRYPDHRLVVVFQPHLYTRTRDFLTEFAESLSAADLLVITDIYPAREAPMAGMSAARIAEMVTCPVHYVPSRHLLPRFVKSLAKDGDVVVGMGAGNISDFAGDFCAELDRPSKPKVMIFYGGDSSEREVSLHSGRAIFGAIKDRYDCSLVDATEMLLNSGSVASLTGANRPDVVFLGVHGTHAEDGAIQGFLELLGIPYTGSGIQASAIAMDKELTKTVLAREGLPVPMGFAVRAGFNGHEVSAKAQNELRTHQYVVKPNAQGSTVGLSFVDSIEDLIPAIEKGLNYDSSVLVEERLTGMEISVPVLGNRALLPVEIVPVSGLYDFASKYAPGATEEICPARLDDDTLALAQAYALKAHKALGCEGATRTDMIVSGEIITILEVNTLPGMTATSLLPKSAETVGITFPDLCDWIVKDALNRNAKSC